MTLYDIINWMAVAISCITGLWLWQILTNRNLKRHNDYIFRDAQQYRSLYERCLNDLKIEEKQNEQLKYVIKLQDILIDDQNNQLNPNHENQLANIIEVVDPETVKQ